MEIKAFPAVSYKAAGDSDRTRTGICSVFGNIDSYGDIVHPGAFTKTLQEGRQRVRHFWNHNAFDAPIAKIDEIREVGRNELPEEILKYAPDATGGLLVKRTYAPDELASRVLWGIDNGAITEMSFGFNTVKADDGEIEGKSVRNLREVALFDTSDVNYGANDATLADLKGLVKEMPLGWCYQQMKLFCDSVKAGRRNSTDDMKLIQLMHESLVSLGFDQCQAIPDEKSLEINTPQKDDEAEAAHKSTSLEFLKLRAQGLRFRAAMSTTLTN